LKIVASLPLFPFPVRARNIRITSSLPPQMSRIIKPYKDEQRSALRPTATSTTSTCRRKRSVVTYKHPSDSYMNSDSASEGESEDIIEERNRPFGGDVRSQRCLQNKLSDSESLVGRSRAWDGEHSDGNAPITMGYMPSDLGTYNHPSVQHQATASTEGGRPMLRIIIPKIPITKIEDHPKAPVMSGDRFELPWEDGQERHGLSGAPG